MAPVTLPSASRSTSAFMATLAPPPLAQPLEDADIVGDGGTAHVEDPRKLGIPYLHVAGLAHELHRAERVHGHAGGADRMAIRFQPAGGVHRQPTVLLSPALGG